MITSKKLIRQMAKTGLLCLALTVLSNCEMIEPELPQPAPFEPVPATGILQHELVEHQTWLSEKDTTTTDTTSSQGNGVVNDDVIDP